MDGLQGRRVEDRNLLPSRQRKYSKRVSGFGVSENGKKYRAWGLQMLVFPIGDEALDEEELWNQTVFPDLFLLPPRK